VRRWFKLTRRCGTNEIRLLPLPRAYSATGRIRTWAHGLSELKSWQARPDQPLASIQEKREASSEVLVNDGRQVGHDEEEDRD
jgi:hypothetical protein